jgi:hypothetical protein
MSAHFHVELGPFTVDVLLDDAGIHMQRGPLAQSIAWEKITGATLIRLARGSQTRDNEEEQRAAQFLGTDAAQKIHELRGKVGEIIVAYRDNKNHLKHTEVPAPLGDAAFLEELQTRLGKKWLGESNDQEQAAKRLHTNTGFFTSIFILAALLGVVAAVAAIALFGLLGPVLNLLSIQKMLLDLQDGDYASLGWHIASYLALFALGYLLHRVIRSRLGAYKGRLRSNRISRP